MEKSIYWLKIIRKGAVMLSSLIIFVGFLLDLIFRFLGISSLVCPKIIAAGILLFAVIFGLSIAISLISDMVTKKKAQEGQAALSETPLFKGKFFDFLKKHENIIKLFSYILALVLSVYFAYGILSTTYTWNIYYYICVFFWIMLVLGTIELFYSKDKKTFITHAVVLGLTLGVLIAATVFAHTLHYDVSAASRIDLKVLDILYLVISLLTTVTSLIIVSDNDVMKVKRTRNFGLGIILMCISTFIYHGKQICNFILEKVTLDGGNEYFVTAMTAVVIVVIGVSLLAMFNAGANTTHYIKTKNYLGLVDITASAIAVILSLVGILELAKVIIYL